MSFPSRATMANSLVSSSTESGLSLSLHPLPLLSISEHYTRTRLQACTPTVRSRPLITDLYSYPEEGAVVGALLGTQTGREIEIANSFEFAFVQGTLDIDHGLFTTRRDQFKQVFPTYEVLGWYTCGEKPTIEDLSIQKQLLPYNENPLFLQMSPDSVSHGKELPVVIYECITEIVANQSQSFFIRAPYRIETGEAERVAVDHAAKPSGQGSGGENPEVANLATQRNALKMLQERVVLIVEYLQKVSQGQAPRDQETLRQIAALVNGLPAAESLEFKEEYMTESTDAALASYLATLTKELGSTNDLIDRFSLSYTATQGPSVRRRGPRGDL